METTKLKFKQGDYAWFKFSRWIANNYHAPAKYSDKVVDKDNNILIKIDKVDEKDIELPYRVTYLTKSTQRDYRLVDWIPAKYVYEATDEEVFLWKLKN